MGQNVLVRVNTSKSQSTNQSTLDEAREKSISIDGVMIHINQCMRISEHSKTMKFVVNNNRPFKMVYDFIIIIYTSDDIKDYSNCSTHSN